MSTTPTYYKHVCIWIITLHNIIQPCGLVPLTLEYVNYIMRPPQNNNSICLLFIPLDWHLKFLVEIYSGLFIWFMVHPYSQCVYLAKLIWRSTFKSKVSRLQKQKWMSIDIYIFFKCHLIVTCLVVRVILISNVSIDIWFFLHKSHHMSNSILCVSIAVHFFVHFFCVSNVKNLQNLQKLCKIYTTGTIKEEALFIRALFTENDIHNITVHWQYWNYSPCSYHSYWHESLSTLALASSHHLSFSRKGKIMTLFIWRAMFMGHNRFEHKDSGCWDPIPLDWIWSQGNWTQLINWVMLW